MVYGSVLLGVGWVAGFCQSTGALRGALAATMTLAAALVMVAAINHTARLAYHAGSAEMCSAILRERNFPAEDPGERAQLALGRR